jgi:hypothetical protein
MKTSVMMRCPRCEQTSELDNLHLLDRSFKLEWVGLTDDELFKIWVGAPSETEDRFAFVKAVIAKLKEKNT